MQDTINKLLYVKNLVLSNYEKDITHEIFFDTKELIQIIVGIESYSIPYSGSQLKSEDRLVQALAASSGFERSIGMLPTHQEEFYHLLKFNLGNHFRNKPSSEIKDEFITETNIYFKNSKNFSDLTKSEKRNFLKESFSKSNNIFVAAHLLYELDWKRRLKYFFDKANPVFYISDYQNFSFDNIIQMPIYNKIRKSLDNVRPRGKNLLNNYYDAISLTYIYSIFNKYKEGTYEKLPILYDSTGTFINTIERAGLTSEFSVKYGNLDASIIRDSKYFITHGIFKGISSKKNIVSENERIIKHGSKLDSYITSFNQYFEQKDLLQLEKLNINIEEYLNGNFFREVLLEAFKKGILDEAFETIISNKEIYDDEDVKMEVDNYIESFKEGLKSSIGRLIDIREIQTTLKNEITRKIKEIKSFPTYRKPIIPLRDYPLLRYPVPVTVIERLADTFSENGIFSDDEETASIALDSFLGDIILSVFPKNKSKIDDFIYSIYGLSIFYLYNEIINFVNKSAFKNTENIAILSIYALSIVRTKKKQSINELQQIIEKLNSKSDSTDLKEKIQIYTTIGNVKFYWSKIEFPEMNRLDYFSQIKETSSLVKEALNITEKAYQLSKKLEDDDNSQQLMLFTLDLLVFYSVLGASNEDFINNEKYFNDLEDAQETHNQFWQYRFNDTLGRFNFRKAYFETDRNKKIIFAENAKKEIEKAYEISNFDPEFNKFRKDFELKYQELIK